MTSHPVFPRLAAGVLLAILSVSPHGAFAQVPDLTDLQATGAPGQQDLQRGRPPQSGPVDPRTYRVGPGDVLRLSVWGPISDTYRLEVDPEGSVFVQGFGAVQVAGSTLAVARKRLEGLVHARYKNVRVDVGLERVRMLTVYATGELRTPGPIATYGGARVADVLPDSAFTSTGSRRNIVLRHRDGTTSTVDLGRFRFTGVEPDPGWLDDGDVIHVPREVAWVSAWGGVARPQRYELGPHDSLSTLLDMAGGAIPSAVRDSALLVHGSDAGTHESLWVSLTNLEARTYDLPLHDGDDFYVFYNPEHQEAHRVSVVGHVQHAGQYPIDEGLTRISDVIAAAGGFRPGADLASIRLLRQRPQSAEEDPEFHRLLQLSREEMTESEYESFRSHLAALTPDFRIDWNRVVPGDPALDPLLTSGDIIRVERLNNSVRVDGEVRHPGVFEHVPGQPWRYYVTLAGGFTQRAAKTRARITRAANGQSVRARDIEHIQPGDFVWIPERSDVTMWQRFGGLITIAAQAATIYLAVKR